jgi:phytoene synthase
VIDGMEMDLTQNALLSISPRSTLYCDRVAGVVGRMSAVIFGYRIPRTLDYARDLGIAFQLTNIVRDVGEDARRGRIYLPQEDLARFGVEQRAAQARRRAATSPD